MACSLQHNEGNKIQEKAMQHKIPITSNKNRSVEKYIGRRLVVLHKQDTVQAAARAMKDYGVGAVLVEDNGVILGVVTDRDLALHVVGYRDLWAPAALGELVLNELRFVNEKANLEQVVKLMEQYKIRRVPILNSEGQARGLVTLDDLITDHALKPNELANIIRGQLEQSTHSKRGAGLSQTRPQQKS
jgi:CBS domain-containing protein